MKIDEGQEWFYGEYRCNAKNKYGHADLTMDIKMASKSLDHYNLAT